MAECFRSGYLNFNGEIVKVFDSPMSPMLAKNPEIFKTHEDPKLFKIRIDPVPGSKTR